MSPLEQRTFRDACGLFATGVNVITTHWDGHDHGMTANAFMSISLD
ncbi:MAG: flavin reductase, partial [Mesorhizobium sp.]